MAVGDYSRTPTHGAGRNYPVRPRCGCTVRTGETRPTPHTPINTMTSNVDKFRSLCLAALMVLSVVAGAVALSGSAAGASSASIVSLTNAADDNGNDVPDVDGGTTAQHTLTYNIDDISADGDTDTISVTIPAGSYASLDNLTVTDRATGDEIQVTGSPAVSNDGRTATFDIAPDTGDADPLTEECLCGDIMAGTADPDDCELFGEECTPDDPVGACMVSSEGPCKIWLEYGGQPDI
mgnify:CR=1 FL=1